jgi:excisionase family DNA binding protein
VIFLEEAMEKTRAVRGELLSVSQVAEKLNVSKHSVHKLIDNRSLSWFPLMEGKYQIDSADVDEWLASIKIPAGKTLSDHLKDGDVIVEAELLKMLQNLAKQGKLGFLSKGAAMKK